MSVSEDRPTRPRNFYDALVADWTSGCIKCGAEDTVPSLPGSDGRLTLPLCSKHVRWALACRRERIGKQAGQLRRLLLAWCRRTGEDLEAVRRWLDRQ